MRLRRAQCGVAASEKNHPLSPLPPQRGRDRVEGNSDFFDLLKMNKLSAVSVVRF